MKMTFLKTILGTSLIALGCATTSSTAVAASHVKMQGQLWSCPQGTKLIKNDANQYRCERRVLPGWRVSPQQKIKNGKNIPGMQLEGLIIKNGVRKCTSGLRLFKNNAEQYKCLKRALPGWRPAINQGNVKPKPQGYTEVEWTYVNGARKANCRGGYKPYTNNRKQFRCYKIKPAGWIVIQSVQANNGGGMKPYTNSKYDKFRFIKGNSVACRKGKLWFDKGYRAHCGG